VSERQLRILESPEDLARAAAGLFAALAADAIARRGRFAVALAGGSTPKRLYEMLADGPYVANIDWPHLVIFWNDERAVPPDHPESNYKMAWDALLSRVPVDKARMHRMPGEATDADQAALDYQRRIACVFGVDLDGPPPIFDLILLGIGEDGHTASLFPYTAAIEETCRWVVANRVAQKNTHRLTMTLPILNRAAQVVFLVTGEGKASVVSEILEGPPDALRLPSQAVQPGNGQLHWFLDRSAASRLQARNA